MGEETTRYIHGSSDLREVARLERQADFIAPRFHPLLPPAPGDRVLDLATGVGAMAQRLKDRYPGVQVTGLDLRMSQLRHARRNHPGAAAYVQADGSRMPFRDATFDKLYCSWMLEHVPRPVEILQEVRRVLKVGGSCLFIEVDNSSFQVRPSCPEVMEVMQRLNQAQLAGGGDPYVGLKLDGYFREAGFGEVRILPAAYHGSANDPRTLLELADGYAEILESIDEALGQEMIPKIQKAAGHLRTLPGLPDAEFYYRGFMAVATRT
jgi:ubiquinone/menaquinone biosynthesis C-methylase UbiE